MAGACAFDVDENVAASSSNVARPTAWGGRDVAADLGRLGDEAGGRRGGAARSPLDSGVTQEVAPKVLVRALFRQWCSDETHGPTLAGPVSVPWSGGISRA